MKLITFIISITVGILLVTSGSYAWTGDSWGPIDRQTITNIASEMIDSSWTPKYTIRNWAVGSTWYYFDAGTVYTGQAYSQHNPQENWSEFFNSVNTTLGGDTYYGNDCSGFVSISWKLPKWYTTSAFESDLGKGYFYALGEIGDSQYVALLQGDAFNDGGNHIILFNRYVTGGIESMEQTFSTARRKTWTWSHLSTYRPIRRNLIEGALGIADRIQTSCNLDVRACADTNSTVCPVIATEPAGAKGTIIDGPCIADKYQWWKISYDDGVTGWSVEGYLQKINAEILTVASSDPCSGVYVTVSPNDNGGQGSGTTQFARTYDDNAVITLTAPLNVGDNNFQKWQRDGTDHSTDQTTTVTMSADYTMTAVYVWSGEISPMDLNNDGILNFPDFVIFACHWMDDICSGPDWCQSADSDRSGTVDFMDLSNFVDYWLWCSADLDSDSTVDFTDYAVFAGRWEEQNCAGPDWCNGADLNKSGNVDMFDLAVLAKYWLGGAIIY